MALPKPQASKAPASVSDYSGASFTGLNTPNTYNVGSGLPSDPCCLPSGVNVPPILGGHGETSNIKGEQATYAILTPTAH